ncbi:hypothetical protein OG306_33405 [Streptomyces sp. NBC_01241]|nr:hypothetical protein OG306_33405 [Streptomyces sp. NBC_01241]
MTDAMKDYYKAKAERLQSQIDRIRDAYTKAETDYDFSEQVYAILTEDQ